MSNKQLEQRKLGSQGLIASAQGLGCMGMTAFYKSNEDISKEERDERNMDVIKRALESGMNLFDTAWIYQDFQSGETNEGFLGKAIEKFGRDKFVICTKFGITLKGPDSSEATIRAQLGESLERLGTDYIDLYYQHRVDPSTPIEDVMKTLKALVEEGKIKYCGLSECTPDELRRAHAVHPVTAIQMEWSLWAREIEDTLVPVCKELGVAIVAYSPLHRGFLSGLRTKDFADDDWRLNQPRFKGENAKKNESALEKYDAFAKSKNCTPGQLALAWLHAKGDFVFPIPGTTKPHRLLENIEGAFVQLTEEDIQELEVILPKPEGTRYQEQMMGSTFENRL